MSTPKSRKQKGKELENYIADQIVSKGIDKRARRDGASGAGTREKSDIVTSAHIFGRNLGIEAKNYKTASVQDWWRQAEKLEIIGREPIVAYKLFREPYEATKVIIYLNTFLDLVKTYQSCNLRGEIVVDDSRSMNDIVYQARYIKEACNKIINKANNSN